MARVSDAEIERAAGEVVELLRIFDSPRDAGAVLDLAYFAFMCLVFAPEQRSGAISSVRESLNNIEAMLREGWN
jgi:hypothetical protein